MKRMKTIKVGENQCVVKEKVVYYGIPQKEPTNFVIWLDGGGIITNTYPDNNTAKLNFDAFNKAMMEA